MENTDFTTGQIRAVECFQEGWELIKPHYWIMLAITFVGILIGGLIPLGIGLGAMYCGIYYVLFGLADGKRPDFNDLFKGFNYFIPALIATLILVVPMIIFLVVMWVSMAGVMFSMAEGHGRINEAAIFALYGTLFVEGIIMAIVLGCIHAFIIFTYPLIVDRGLSGPEAFKTSAKAVWANLSGVVGLMLCQFALGFIGYLACGIGLYLTLPIMFAGVFVAYRRVFPTFHAPGRLPNFAAPPNAN